MSTPRSALPVWLWRRWTGGSRPTKPRGTALLRNPNCPVWRVWRLPTSWLSSIPLLLLNNWTRYVNILLSSYIILNVLSPCRLSSQLRPQCALQSASMVAVAVVAVLVLPMVLFGGWAAIWRRSRSVTARRNKHLPLWYFIFDFFFSYKTRSSDHAIFFL